MSKGIESFRKERLVQARESRGLTGVALAELSGIGDVNISKYENGHAYPPAERLEVLSKVLRLPISFFLRPLPLTDSRPLFWRSLHVSAKPARTRAIRKFEWAKEIADYLEGFFDFPEVNLPEVKPPQDFRKISSELIEQVASDCRKHWKVDRGPLPNVVRLLEKNGIVLSKIFLESEHLDAFSQVRDNGRPFILLSSDKASAVRSRFDALHELGHLLLHSRVDARTFNSPQNWKELEKQAHLFAGTALLPSEEFLNDLFSPSLDGFRALKTKWKTAMGAMIQRCMALEIIDEDQARRLWMNMTRRGWKQKEPLDDVLEDEKPRLLGQSIEMLVDEGVRSKSEILEAVGLSADDATELTWLPSGYFESGFGEVIPLSKLKSVASTSNPTHAPAKVISFPNAFGRRG